MANYIYAVIFLCIKNEIVDKDLRPKAKQTTVERGQQNPWNLCSTDARTCSFTRVISSLILTLRKDYYVEYHKPFVLYQLDAR